MHKKHSLYGTTIEERIKLIIDQRVNKLPKNKRPVRELTQDDINKIEESRIKREALGIKNVWKSDVPAEDRLKVPRIKTNRETAHQKNKREKREAFALLKKERAEYKSKYPPQYISYINRANKKQLRFELSVEEFTHITKLSCAYCGGAGGGIDRIDSSEGYIKDNILPCCFPCNMMKYKHSTDFFLERIKKIYKHLNLDKHNTNLFGAH